MAVTTAQTVDVSQALADLLEGIDGLRVYAYVADKTRPPAAVIGLPEIDFADTTGGFCTAVWIYSITVITPRANDLDSQKDLSRLVMQVANALRTDVPGLISVEPLSARPVTVTVAGTDLPGYLLQVRIRA